MYFGNNAHKFTGKQKRQSTKTHNKTNKTQTIHNDNANNNEVQEIIHKYSSHYIMGLHTIENTIIIITELHTTKCNT